MSSKNKFRTIAMLDNNGKQWRIKGDKRVFGWQKKVGRTWTNWKGNDIPKEVIFASINLKPNEYIACH